MFKKIRIKKQLQNNLESLNQKLLTINSQHRFKHTILKERQTIKNRIALLYNKVRIKVYSITNDTIIVNLKCVSNYESSMYFFDVFNYQLGKVLSFDILDTFIIQDGYVNTYQFKLVDFGIFKFTVSDISKSFHEGRWMLEGTSADEKKVLNYFRVSC